MPKPRSQAGRLSPEKDRFSGLLFALLLVAWAGSGCRGQRADNLPLLYIHFEVGSWDRARPWVYEDSKSYLSAGVMIKGRGILSHLGTATIPSRFKFSVPGHDQRHSLRLLKYDPLTGLALFETPQKPPEARNFSGKIARRHDMQGEFEVIWSTGNGVSARQDSFLADKKLGDSGAEGYTLPTLVFPEVQGRLLGGEPVLQAGKIAAIVTSADKGGVNAIPGLFVDRFLGGGAGADANDPDGYVTLGCQFQALTEAAEKRHYRLPENSSQGVLINHCAAVTRQAGSDPWLMEEDVLLEVNGRPVRDDGDVETPWGSMPLKALVSTFLPAEPLKVKVLRANLPTELVLSRPMRHSSKHLLIPAFPPATRGHYLIVGGLVLQELTADYFKYFRAPSNINAPVGLYSKLANDNDIMTIDATSMAPERVIFLSDILADAVNIGQRRQSHQILVSVNGVKAHSLDHLMALIEGKASDSIDLIFGTPSDRKIFKVSSLKKANERIRFAYDLPADVRMWPLADRPLDQPPPDQPPPRL